MFKLKDLNVLNLSKGATWEEIKESYDSLRELYSLEENSFLFNAIEELDDDNKEIELKKIKDAYKELESTYLSNSNDINLLIILKREELNLSIHQVSKELLVDDELIVAIEECSFDKFKDSAYLRWILKKYLNLLSLNIVEDYMKYYREEIKNNKET